MSNNNLTKSESEELQAVMIQGSTEEQNSTHGVNKKQQLDEVAANIEVPSNPKYAEPTAGVTQTANIHANADIIQSEPDSNISNIDPSTSLAAETEAATGLDYTHNPDFLLPSGETMAQGKRRMRDILSREREASEEDEKPAAQEAQQNDALMSREEQFGSVLAPGIMRNDNSSAANLDSVVRPGALFVANRNNDVSNVTAMF